MRRVVAKFASKVGRMDVKNVVIAEEVHPPDRVEQLLTGEDHARIANEGGQEVELEDGQIDGLASLTDRAAPRIDEEISGPQKVSGVSGSGSATPQEGVHPGHQLAGENGLVR